MALWNEIQYLRNVVPAVLALRTYKPGTKTTVADVLEGVVDAHRDRPALITDDLTLSYADLDARANRVAHHFASVGIGPGDVVGLDMENRPDHVAVWFGLAKIGATTALLNTNLAGPALAHSVRVAAPKAVVIGAEVADRWSSAQEHLDDVDPPVWAQGGIVDDAADLDAALAAAADRRPSPAARARLTLGDTDLFYIYTSGTTGLPKAAHFSHLKCLITAIGSAKVLELTPEDRQYVCLPLYHTAGAVMALGAALMTGAAAVIVPKFSATRFWTDAVKHGVTSFQYIGELMRYLVNTPPVPEERQHQIRVCTGNGLRPEVWPEVVRRFGITEIREFYGATEGNFGIINFDNRIGSVGRSPAWVRRLIGLQSVRFDVEAGEVERGDDGFCVAAGPGEVGELIGRLPKRPDSITGRFEGYSDPDETERKILRDVFERGDAYFRSGDLLRRDEDDYFYFVDRIGDTFRWKGENVATTEVAEVLSVLPDVAEANVYGIEIPGQDGRAGMAALVLEGDGVDLARLYETTERDLAPYARPVLLRLQPQIEVTGTFKHRKVDLVEDGFDPTVVTDPLYFRDTGAGTYVPVDAALHQRITAGDVRV